MREPDPDYPDEVLAGGRYRADADPGDESQAEPEPQWVSVSSSDLAAVWYDPKQSLLRIRFLHARKDGVDTYSYLGVPQRVYDSLLAAASQGKFFHSQIKNSYPCPEARGG